MSSYLPASHSPQHLVWSFLYAATMLFSSPRTGTGQLMPVFPGRNQSTPQKVTVVIAAYETWGLRPIWMKSIVEKYVSEAYKHIIDQVIVVWNNPDEPPPEFPEAKVLKMTRNSLNNRWVEPVEHVKTDAVLVLDNDVMVDANGLSCMLNWWEKFPDRIVGPYARQGFNSVSKDIASLLI